MGLEHPARFGQQFHGTAAQGHDALRPFGRLEHHAAVQVLGRQRDGTDPANCAHSSHSSTMSLVLLLSRMRSSLRRRCSRMDTPAKPSRPEQAARHHRHQLFGPGGHERPYTKCGVSMQVLFSQREGFNFIYVFK